MRAAARGAILLAALGWRLPVGSGVETFSYGFLLESSAAPDLEASGRIEGETGSEVLFTAGVILDSTGITGLEGPSGWSWSIWHAGVEVDSISIAGTVSARQADGGLRDDEPEQSFIKFEIVDPLLNGGRAGVIQGVVLSLRRLRTLPPNSRQLLAKINYRAVIGAPGTIAFLRYQNGLRGSGQPVINIVTLRGASRAPSLGERQIFIGQGAVPEAGNCGDGIDNDRDGWTDCLDPECFNVESCGGEDCLDGADNDGDGLIDCRDPDCSRSAACTENCGDGIDNDGDGQVDCADADCVGQPECPPREFCRDGADNDGDGLADCDDPDCKQDSACRTPEDCQDGIDNDEDGLIDCADRECAGIPPCPVPENCRDGIDNDEDGFIDCDDPDCSGISGCRKLENCQDGIDNDQDGFTDCDDRDCAGKAHCPPRELCEGEIDEDGDGLVDCLDPDCELIIPCWTGPSGFDLVLSADGAYRERGSAAGGGGSPGGMAQRNVLGVGFTDEATIEVVTYIIPFPAPQPEGPSGWSISVAHDKQVLSLVGPPTLAGTDAEEIFAGGFNRTEEARDPGGGGIEEDDADGFISGVVLSLLERKILSPASAQSVARATYRVRDNLGSAKFPMAAIRFRDGLRGAGQPVRNTLTISGRSVAPVHLIPLEIERAAAFIRGDANGDGRLNIADPIWCINEVIRGGPPTTCRRAADANADDRYDLADVIYLVQYIFLHGPSIPAPFPRCGAAPGPQTLDCPRGSAPACPS